MTGPDRHYEDLAARDWFSRLYAVLDSQPWWWSLLPRKARETRSAHRLERHGIFHARSYLDRNPDVAQNGMDPLRHYILHGMAEGRTLGRIAPVPQGQKASSDSAELFRAGDDRYEVGRRTVFIVNHDSSRTGAPLVGLNLARALRERWNVFVFVGREESLVEDFRANSVGLIVGWRTEAETEAIIREMKRIYRLDALVVNSIEGSGFVRAAVRSGVAVVALVHEFADYTAPMGRTADTVRLADRVIVPAALVEQSLQKEVGFVCGARAPNIVVRRQGALPYLPQDDDDTSTAMTAPEIRDFVAERSGGRTRIVLGAGYVGQRKGVDLFVQTAAEVARRRDDVAFLWVGDGYAPRTDMHYSIWVEQMIQRMGLERIVHFLPSQPNLDASFDASAVFYLPSRLDPFPNVVIDALNASARVVCFRDATGCAELFTGEAPAFRGAAVPYCDVAAAADAIIAAIDASPRETGEDTPLRDDHNARAAAGAFCFDAYVADLEREIELARASAAAIEDATQRIAASGSFDARFYEGAPSVHVTGALRDYVASSSKGLARRNPHAGFSDNLWRNRVGAGSARCALDEALGEDVTDTHACHRVGSGDLRMPQVGRVALHIHFHYADLAEDFVRRLVAARAAVDVFATVTSQNGLRTVEYAFMRYEGGAVQTILVPNRGRDVGPLLVDLGPLLAGYDIVGHLHAKRSLVIGRAAGDQWRDFLLDTLLGDGNGVLADILRLFAHDQTLGPALGPALGMVFAEDPHNVGWTGNRAFADALAARMTPAPRLPERPVFPIGTMFWARAQALQPLWDLALTRNDMPAEPLAYDGTILHAVERMLPATCQATNLSWATIQANNTSR